MIFKLKRNKLCFPSLIFFIFIIITYGCSYQIIRIQNKNKKNTMNVLDSQEENLNHQLINNDKKLIQNSQNYDENGENDGSYLNIDGKIAFLKNVQGMTLDEQKEFFKKIYQKEIPNNEVELIINTLQNELQAEIDFIQLYQKTRRIYQEKKFEEAIDFAKKTIELGKKFYAPKKILFVINDFASMFCSIGYYKEAENYLLISYTMCQKLFGDYHQRTISIVSDLANLYMLQGRYGEAEPYMIGSYQRSKKQFGIHDPNIVKYMGDLGHFYYLQKRYDEAGTLIEDSYNLSEEIFGKQHPTTIKHMNFLAEIYRSQGLYNKAETISKNSYERAKDLFGKEHPETLVTQNNLGLIYISQGRYNKAEKIYKDLLMIKEKILGKNDLSTINTIHNLATVYKQKEQYEESEAFFKRALQQREKLLGKTHQITIETLHSLMLMYAATSKKIKTIKHKCFLLLKQLEDRILKQSNIELKSIQSENVRRIYLSNLSKYYDLSFSFACEFPEPEHILFASNMLLRGKQILAEESAFQHYLLHRSEESEIVTLKEKISKLKSNISFMIRNGCKQKEIDDKMIELIGEEQSLRNKTKVIYPNLKKKSINISNIIKRLPLNTGLIEFRVYYRINFDKILTNPNYYENTPHIMAYFLVSNDNLGPKLFFQNIGSFTDIYNAFEQYEKSKQSKEKSKLLYNLIFREFEEQIKKLSHLYIAPDNFLSLIPFSSLITNDGKYFVQHLQLTRLHTGRDLLSNNNLKAKPILISIGGINYGNVLNNNQTQVSQLDMNRRFSDEFRDGLKNLKNSLSEADMIKNLYEIYKPNGKAYLYYGLNATEKLLKSIKSPQILHLATHAFVLGEKTFDNPEKLYEYQVIKAERPLMLSGFALADANSGINGVINQDGEDGLMYSIEVLEMNLHGTELVTLSACDTGKGVFDYSEGIYGLSRAFRMAGAKNVIMTLKPINDRLAETFMVKFYDTYLSSKEYITPSFALHKTRVFFIEQKKNKTYQDPEFWSPYVIIGR